MQISSAAWSPSGARLAFATKKKELFILDPRDSSGSLVSAPAHDSIRPSRLAWASEDHLVSSGFNRAASRELILFHLSPSTNQLVKLGSTQLDVSPAPLFPFVDLDTRIVLLHSRGDRSCLAYSVNLAPKDAYDAFDKLPSFEAGGLQSGWAFLPKARGDVRKVEIVKGLRLTPSTIEVVAFTVPRAKVRRRLSSVLGFSRPSQVCAHGPLELTRARTARAGRLLPERHLHPDAQRREAQHDGRRVPRRRKQAARDHRLEARGDGAL